MVSIRRGKESDSAHYVKSQLEAFPDESWERHNRYFRQKIRRNEIFVLIKSGKYIGHLTYNKSISTPFPDCFYIEEFVVAEKERGHGHGNVLFDYALKKAKDLGFDRVMLNTKKACKAIDFYLYHGFKVVGNLNTVYGDEEFYELVF